MLDLESIRARVDAVGNEPITFGREGTYWAISMFYHESWNHDVLAGSDAPAYADLFAHARDDIRALIAEVEKLRKA